MNGLDSLFIEKKNNELGRDIIKKIKYE